MNFLSFIRPHHIRTFRNQYSPYNATISCSRVLPWFNFLHNFTNPFVHVITIPPNILRPKAKKRYKPVIYNDVDDDLYVLKAYDKAMTRSPWWSHRLRNDLILWDSISFTAEFVKVFRIDSSIDTNIRQSILSIINNNWDSFYEE